MNFFFIYPTHELFLNLTNKGFFLPKPNQVVLLPKPHQTVTENSYDTL